MKAIPAAQRFERMVLMQKTTYLMEGSIQSVVWARSAVLIWGQGACLCFSTGLPAPLDSGKAGKRGGETPDTSQCMRMTPGPVRVSCLQKAD